ncbi:serine hydrolase domain-containing protein [Cytobacillus sp. IB215665]|uniref:serine hydrolase domain-containing protein n=1 Tax=Cytobacillus sp. IB215665 TaxID=3097357 RepID=UPI002A0FE1D7|nr:serine hydrolase domain-containing protein [Cytobacillus sp. IB215665]MDX8365495.1 serine hydrolase domain-containing protein [Cytobacillus sp. IB215665]
MKKSLFILLISFLLIISACSTENSTKKGNELSGKSDIIDESTIENTTSDLDIIQGSNNIDLYSKLDNAMTHFEKYHDFSGAVYVGIEGKEIYSRALGMANHVQGTTNTLDTKFIMASLTKQFTAAAILLLEERGLLELDDQITNYLHGPTQWEGITIHHLLSMSSGIVNDNHPKFTENFEKTFGSNIPFPLPTIEEAVALFNDIPLNFKPGEKYEYSNSNYLLLGMIIEQISGDKYESFLGKNIFKPLGMLNSGYSVDWDVQDNKAIGYDKIRSENDLYPIQYDYFLTHSAGGLYTTINDLVTWDRALYSEKLFKKETIAKMYAPHTKISSNSSYFGFEYGYGWFTKGNIVEHDGYIYGYRTNIYRELDSEFVIIILSNNESIGWSNINNFTNILNKIVKGEW